MIEQDKLSAKQIKEEMSATPWDEPKQEREVNDYDQEWFWYSVDDGAGSFDKEVDAIAATTAVNNTYGKGLNPEVYEDVVKMLEEAKMELENLYRKTGGAVYHNTIVKRISESLNKSRI